MSQHIQTHIDIHAPIAQVWRVLLDWKQYPHWNPFILRVEGEAQAGHRLSVTIQPPGGKTMRFNPELLCIDKEATLSWQGQFLFPGLFDGHHHFQLEPLGEQACRLHHSETFSGLLVPIFGQKRLTRIRQGFEAMNQALKQRAEYFTQHHFKPS